MRKRFTRLLGNDETKIRISDLIISSALPHALMIVGPEGSGKHTLAKEIAAAMNCENKASEEHPLPCGICRNCRRIHSGNFPDVSFLARKDDKVTVGVEEVRDFRDDMFLSSTEADFKFYIIEEADVLTRDAQNALLKVLEEPPECVHIILLCRETDKILTTVKSRAQLIQTEIFSPDELCGHIKELSPSFSAIAAASDDRTKGILLASGGVIGKALSLLDENRIAETLEERNLIKSFIEAIPKKVSFLDLYSVTSAMPKGREELRALFENIRNALRDMMASKLSENISPIFFLTSEEAGEISKSLSKARISQIYGIITDALSDLDKNVNISVLLTDITVKIKNA